MSRLKWWESDAAGEQDSVFISIADLFSLLSLAIIYVVFTSSPTAMSRPPSWEMVRATVETGSLGGVVDRKDVYIAFAQSREGAVVQESWNGQVSTIPLMGATDPMRKLSELLGSANPRRDIYVVISRQNVDPSAAEMFVNTLVFLKDGHYDRVRVAVL